MQRALFIVSMLGLTIAGFACTSENPSKSDWSGSKGGAGGLVGVGGASTTEGMGGVSGVGGGGGFGASAGAAGARQSGGTTGGVGGAAGRGTADAAVGSGGQLVLDGSAGGANGQAGKDADSANLDASKSGVASSLDGFLVEMPCGPLSEANQVCSVEAKYDKQTFTRSIGGDATTVYDVTLKVQGIVEPLTYTGGTAIPTINPHYYVGGTPQDRWYRIWSLRTSAPSQVYYFNSAPSVGHVIFSIDFTVTIPIRGGSTVTIVSDGQNGNSIANFSKLTVPSVPLTQPYNGQFLYLKVVSATPKLGA